MSSSTLDKIEKMQVILRNMKSDIKRQDRLNSINRMELTNYEASAEAQCGSSMDSNGTD